MKNIYEEAVKRIPKNEIDHHYSDLYLKVTPTSRKLVDEYEWRGNVTTFRDQIEGKLWYEIPFAFTPYWEDPYKFT